MAKVPSNIVLLADPPAFVAFIAQVQRGYQQLAAANNNPDFGPTTSRPKASTVTTLSTGQFFFDTTLGKPIWWAGAEWVDATGTPV